MDVKDVGKRVLIEALSPISLKQATKARVASSAATQNEPSVTTNISAHPMPAAVAADLRKNLNEAISSLNVASDATNSIADYLSSINGVLEQAQNGGASPQRQKVLESEANQLVEEVKRTARQVADVSTAPIPDDQVRKDIEEKLGKTLDILLPEDRGAQDGLQTVSFSRKDSIIQTITNVAKAKARIDEMRKAMQDSSESLKGAVLSYEIAQQNSEASQATVRDVDAAAKLASGTQANIYRNPEAAIDAAAGKLSANALSLTK